MGLFYNGNGEESPPLPSPPKEKNKENRKTEASRKNETLSNLIPQETGNRVENFGCYGNEFSCLFLIHWDSGSFTELYLTVFAPAPSVNPQTILVMLTNIKRVCFIVINIKKKPLVKKCMRLGISSTLMQTDIATMSLYLKLQKQTNKKRENCI